MWFNVALTREARRVKCRPSIGRLGLAAVGDVVRVVVERTQWRSATGNSSSGSRLIRYLCCCPARRPALLGFVGMSRVSDERRRCRVRHRISS